MWRPALVAGFCFAVIAETARTAPSGEVNDPEVRSLTDRSEIAELRKQIKALEESLALANTEADTFHQRWLELRLKVEAMGMDALTSNEKSMEQKIVRLIGELYRTEKEKLELENRAVQFLEAWKAYQLAGALDRIQARANLEVTRRKLLETIRPDEADFSVARDLNSGIVTSYDPELGTAIVNFGKAQGARPDIPFRILRNDQVIGRCRTVEVREYLTAVRIVDLVGKETVQVGDRLLLETMK
ncbi:MAG: hypothetical protein AAFY98_02555 [Verrucomicrobiota bacterium]